MRIYNNGMLLVALHDSLDIDNTKKQLTELGCDTFHLNIPEWKIDHMVAYSKGLQNLIESKSCDIVLVPLNEVSIASIVHSGFASTVIYPSGVRANGLSKRVNEIQIRNDKIQPCDIIVNILNNTKNKR